MQKVLDATILGDAQKEDRAAHCRINRLCFITLLPLPSNSVYHGYNAVTKEMRTYGRTVHYNRMFDQSPQEFAKQFLNVHELLDEAVVIDRRTNKQNGESPEYVVVQYGPGDSIFCTPKHDPFDIANAFIGVIEFKKKDLAISICQVDEHEDDDPEEEYNDDDDYDEGDDPDEEDDY